MIPISSILRIARPTDNLQVITKMYIDGLGFELLSEFVEHQGFSGSIIGHPNHNYHLEFTRHSNSIAGKAPTPDNLLVFYIRDLRQWQAACETTEVAGFALVKSYNPYWDVVGKTFEDIDGYRVVLQNQEWIV
ncbi:MAG: prolyl endopeptidase [Verrucomicrobiaceae bacterium]|nr:prolyl endopeptidase [Verrucomicrobiaceae bacterium]